MGSRSKQSTRAVRIRNRMLLQAARVKTAKCCTRLSKWSVSGRDRTLFQPLLSLFSFVRFSIASEIVGPNGNAYYR